MDLDEFTQDKEQCYSSEDGFLIWKISNGEQVKPGTILTSKENIVTHVIVEQGSIQIKCNGNTYLMPSNTYANYIDYPSVTILSTSQDCKAYIMFSTTSYNAMLFKNNPPIPFSFVLKMRNHPLETLPPKTIKLLLQKIERIVEASISKEHLFRNELIKCSICIFMLEIANIFIKNEENQNIKSNRQKALFIEFIKLLSVRVREEHNVSFYASTLCITPQYLNRIVKAHTGRNTHEWICTTLSGEITQRLEHSNDTMQQIAHDLNFPDQATMAKFYKKQTGFTLTEYRRKILKEQYSSPLPGDA